MGPIIRGLMSAGAALKDSTPCIRIPGTQSPQGTSSGTTPLGKPLLYCTEAGIP